jgi:hypothetical protein
MTDGMKGLLIGGIVGCLVAAAQWQDDAGAAIRVVVVTAAIGFTVGYFVGKRRTA